MVGQRFRGMQTYEEKHISGSSNVRRALLEDVQLDTATHSIVSRRSGVLRDSEGRMHGTRSAEPVQGFGSGRGSADQHGFVDRQKHSEQKRSRQSKAFGHTGTVDTREGSKRRHLDPESPWRRQRSRRTDKARGQAKDRPVHERVWVCKEKWEA